jgi:hypothetical protein
MWSMNVVKNESSEAINHKSLEGRALMMIPKEAHE